METMKDVYENAKNKSTKKAIPIRYKGEIILLDAEKVKKFKIKAFTIAAVAVMVGVSIINAPKISKFVEDTKEVITENIDEIAENHAVNERTKKLEKSFDKHIDSIIKTIHVPVDATTKSPDKEKFYEMLANNANANIYYMYAYISFYKDGSEELDGMLRYLSAINNARFYTTDTYLNFRGYNSFDDFKQYCINMYDQQTYQYLEQASNQKQKPDEVPLYENLQKDSSEWVKIILSGENMDVELYNVYQQIGNNEELDEVISKLAFAENETYTNLKEYVNSKGFDYIQYWEEYCREKIEMKSGRTM